MQEKFLPIGSVVLLKGGTKKVMITGYCMKTAEHPEKKAQEPSCFTMDFSHCSDSFPAAGYHPVQNCLWKRMSRFHPYCIFRTDGC